MQQSSSLGRNYMRNEIRFVSFAALQNIPLLFDRGRELDFRGIVLPLSKSPYA